MIMIAVFATVGSRDLTTHIFIAISFMAFAALGIINDFVLNTTTQRSSIDGSKEPLLEQVEQVDVEVQPLGKQILIGGKRFGSTARRRNATEPIGPRKEFWRRPFAPFKKGEQGDGEWSVVKIVPYMAQAFTFTCLAFIVSRLDAHDDLDSLDEIDPDNAITTIVQWSFWFLALWLPVQFFYICIAYNYKDMVIFGTITHFWTALWVFAVSAIMYFKIWDEGNALVTLDA
jgi:hypothetical protein